MKIWSLNPRLTFLLPSCWLLMMVASWMELMHRTGKICHHRIKFLNSVEWVLLVISNNLQILKSQQLILCNAACVKKQSMPLVFLARSVAYGYIVIVHLGLRSHLGRMAGGAATAENGGSQSHLSGFGWWLAIQFQVSFIAVKFVNQITVDRLDNENKIFFFF